MSRIEKLIYDPKIEKILKRLKKETGKQKEAQFAFGSPSWNLVVDTCEIEIVEELTMANDNRTLRKLATPDLNQQLLCITFPTIAAYEFLVFNYF